MWSKKIFSFLSSYTNSAIIMSITDQITKLRTFLKSTLNGLLKNVQLLLIGPSGAREIEDRKVFPIFVDTLYHTKSKLNINLFAQLLIRFSQATTDLYFEFGLSNPTHNCHTRPNWSTQQSFSSQLGPVTALSSPTRPTSRPAVQPAGRPIGRPTMPNFEIHIEHDRAKVQQY